MNSNFETSVSDIRIVSPERNYWFLRTYGGSTFEDNYINGYVGIGFNEIPMQYLKNAKGDDFASLEILRGFIEKQYDIKKGSLTRWINQLVEFQHSVKIGDMVLIPSENSDNILFGEITSDIYVVKEKRTFLHNDKYESYP
jgi:restriction system protein